MSSDTAWENSKYSIFEIIYTIEYYGDVIDYAVKLRGFMSVAIHQVDEGTNLARAIVDTNVSKLKKSILASGQLATSPFLLIYTGDGRYICAGGNHRLKALRDM